MGYKKTLGIISIFVLAMFALMMSSSYAWYSYNNASTTFDTTTSGDDIEVVYRNNSYISTITAVPISSNDINSLSERNNFSINVNNDDIREELMVSIDLISVSIDEELKNNNFRYELLYNGNSVSKGNFMSLKGDTFNILKGINLSNLGNNDFELRVYLLDDGSNQNNLMNKTFRGIISVNVISRIKVNLDKQDIDILFDNIVIDGVVSDSLPNSGRYSMSSVCEKGSNISWDAVSRSIIYEAGSVINDRCSLKFTRDDNYMSIFDLLKSGDYVKYSGNNGCTNKSCSGVNANYVDDRNMGYCSSANNKFIVNGWRVLANRDNSVYIVSAGSVECVNSSMDLDSLALKYCNTDYVYGNICNSANVRAFSSDDYKSLIGKNVIDCDNKSSSKLCGYNNDLIDNGGYYFINGSKLYSWNAYDRYVDNSNGNYGLRPVIRIDDKVYVIGGKGTYADPYILGVK